MSEQDGPRIIVGLERVLYLAATEPEFREALEQDAEEAIARRGLALGDSELAMLRAVPPDQLRANIRGLDISDDNLQRRTFLRAVAASAATVTSVAALTGCDDEDKQPRVDTGIRADGGPDLAASMGIKPDMPGADQKVKVPDHGPAPTGIRPGG